MDKQKQVEEMAKVLEFCCNGENIENCNSDRSCDSCRAKYLYNAGYRKIPEGAVVLTREEYDGKSIIVEMSGGHKLKLSVGKFVEMSKILEEHTRKETAEKFSERVKMAFYYHFDELIPSIMAKDIDEISKELIGGK